MITAAHEDLVALRAEGIMTILERTHGSLDLVKSPFSFDVNVWLGTGLRDEVATAQNGVKAT